MGRWVVLIPQEYENLDFKWRARVEEANALPLHIPQLIDHLFLVLSD